MRRELHDGLGPLLTMLALRAGAARAQLVNGRLADADATLAQLQSDVAVAAAELRAVLGDTRIPRLAGTGLAEAVRDQMARHGDGRMVLRAGDLPPLPADVEEAAFRIVCEALHNAARHAGASRIKVSLEAVPGGLAVLVADDGTGLPPEPRQGLGLRSMRTRAEQVGGRLTLSSAPGDGLAVRVFLPFSHTYRPARGPASALLSTAD
ncbi:sensor histidine kinase [Actinocorallia longicatena]|uniref:Oxygen sensor histidine kinase NreB n=1 Tax=Actinocorallia longicatena TaxID=111803 RepID=A0ABP6QAU3_9ACTN